MKTDSLRNQYIQFFKEKKHKVFSSDSLVCDDPSLLFTSAGMNQFKPYFLRQKKDIKRAVSCQRCLRTGDIDEVGKTPFHHTFFEMLGNFSFGDYFKKEAIKFAWEFLTRRLNINPASLSVSVYKDDKEAFNIWKNEVGVRLEKIFKFGQKENFWPANVLEQGPCGPCGPCAEVFFDRGEKAGCGKDTCNPACGCGRFVEIWNLVFTQFDRRPDGQLIPLPQNNIDTGMGLERMASVLQGKASNFEIDILYPAVEESRKIIGSAADQEVGLINSIVDHSRAVIFAIADGVYPSNEGCGYVARRLLRKSLWTANLLDYKEPFIYRLVPLFAGLMKNPYPYLEEKIGVIGKVIKKEEEKFISTLEEGKSKLDDCLRQLKEKGKENLPADKLFSLYDTYGFPFELTEIIACQRGVKIDRQGAQKLLAKQKEQSRSHSKFSDDIFVKDSLPGCSSLKKTIFTGHSYPESSVEIVNIFKLAGEKVNWQEQVNCLKKEEEGVVVLDKTPFYAESGGQLSDQGLISTGKGKFLVQNVYKGADKAVYFHQGKVTEGQIEKGEGKASVDINRRKALARAHTATHLLQSALREVLGEHVSQQGSLVDVDRLRFDFTHFQALTSEEIDKVESMVNSYILKAEAVDEKRDISLEEAKKEGALAFFKEKYAGKVRIISISSHSKELCGGTHLNNTSEAGGFGILSESSVSSGVRRIEAACGWNFYQLYKDKQNQIAKIAAALKSGSSNIDTALEKTLNSLKESKNKISELEKERVALVARELIDNYLQQVAEKNFLAYDFSRKDTCLQLDYASFFTLVDLIKRKLATFFIFFLGEAGGKKRFFCSSSQDLVRAGLSGKEFIKRFQAELSLKGGGSSHLAQGVVLKNSQDLLEKVKECFSRMVSDESS